MGKKYKVLQGDRFLGHHQAHSPKEAVEKAIQTYGCCYPITNNSFTVYRASQKIEVVREEV